MKPIQMLVTVTPSTDMPAALVRKAIREAVQACGDFHGQRVSVQSAPKAGRPSPDASSDTEFWAVIAQGPGEGVLFTDRRDARWTLLGKGRASCPFGGVPTLGDEFRDSYGTNKDLVLVKVQMVGEPTSPNAEWLQGGV